MSTAGRPTFKSAVGKGPSSFRSLMTSGKDQTAHTKLKFRQLGQASEQEVSQKNLRYELEQKETKYVLEKDKNTAWLAKEEAKIDVPLLLKNQPELDSERLEKYDDKDAEVEDSDDFDSSRYEIFQYHFFNMSLT